MKNIIISESLLKEVCEKRIDISQVEEVISLAEETMDKTYDPESDIYFAHRKIGSVTIWVSYKVGEEEIEVKSVYAHRLDIEER